MSVVQSQAQGIEHAAPWPLRFLTTALAAAECAGIDNSNNLNVTCTNATDSMGDGTALFACDKSFYGVHQPASSNITACQPCPGIAHCNNASLICYDAQVSGLLLF
jgi:hypothetical protein